jgi:hypothetical protein
MSDSGIFSFTSFIAVCRPGSGKHWPVVPAVIPRKWKLAYSNRKKSILHRIAANALRRDLRGRERFSGEGMKMKAAFTTWVAVAAMTVAASAQSAATSGAASAAGSAQSGGAETSAAGSEYAAAQTGQAPASAAQATNVSAELSKKIDTKDAKAGDQVVAKTTSEARLADGTKLPKGSKLVGHVTDVQAKSHDIHDSHLAFAFDHAVLKDGREVPVHATMQSLSAPAAMAASSSDDMMASSSMSPVGADSMARSGGSGHASVGGVSGAVPGTVGTTAGGLGNNVPSGAAMNGAGHLAADGTPLNNTAGLNAGPSGQALPVGNLNGVTFNTVNATVGAANGGIGGSAGSSTATMLTGHGRNVSLESGSQMTLSVVPQ